MINKNYKKYLLFLLWQILYFFSAKILEILNKTPQDLLHSLSLVCLLAALKQLYKILFSFFVKVLKKPLARLNSKLEVPAHDPAEILLNKIFTVNQLITIQLGLIIAKAIFIKLNILASNALAKGSAVLAILITFAVFFKAVGSLAGAALSPVAPQAHLVGFYWLFDKCLGIFTKCHLYCLGSNFAKIPIVVTVPAITAADTKLVLCETIAVQFKTLRFFAIASSWLVSLLLWLLGIFIAFVIVVHFCIIN